MSKKIKKNSDYISIKESRAIMKYNIAQMKYYESLKNIFLGAASSSYVYNIGASFLSIHYGSHLLFLLIHSIHQCFLWGNPPVYQKVFAYRGIYPQTDS